MIASLKSESISNSNSLLNEAKRFHIMSVQTHKGRSIQVQLRFFKECFNPILYGLFLYVKIRGGSFWPPPPWLKLEKWIKLGKRHFLAKIDYCCPLFMHLELNYYHFWLKKGQKNCRRRGFEPRHRRVPPLDCMWKKLST